MLIYASGLLLLTRLHIVTTDPQTGMITKREFNTESQHPAIRETRGSVSAIGAQDMTPELRDSDPEICGAGAICWGIACFIIAAICGVIAYLAPLP